MRLFLETVSRMQANIPFPTPRQSGKEIAYAPFFGADAFPFYPAASFFFFCIFCRKALHLLSETPACLAEKPCIFSEALFGMRFHPQSVLCGFLCRYPSGCASGNTFTRGRCFQNRTLFWLLAVNRWKISLCRNKKKWGV